MEAYQNIIKYNFNDGTQLMFEGGNLPLPSSEDTLQIVSREESLLDLAFSHYGSHKEWVTIAYANGIIDPWENLLGRTLIIPAL